VLLKSPVASGQVLLMVVVTPGYFAIKQSQILNSNEMIENSLSLLCKRIIQIIIFTHLMNFRIME
jgi:hypothetical protein